jgi:GNAT superfamily N-acetyltransferase
LIGWCEEAYRVAGIPCAFKLTGASEPDGLDEVLAARGYRRESETLVQQLPGIGQTTPHDAIELTDRPDGGWLATWEQLSGRGRQVSLQAALLEAIQAPAIYALAEVDGAPVGCARAVLSGDRLWLFDLTVAPEQRGQGLGRAFVESRLAWGVARGARSAFLQVMAENRSARRLQARLGFTESYRYWYRVRT